jgi:Tfp pilus assembly protein FimV
VQIDPPSVRFLAAFAACTTLSTTGASALTLGNLVVRSHLGEPLHAQIAVRTGADESIDETCITLPRPVSASEAIPYLSRASFSVVQAPGGQVIRIRSAHVINDPVLKLLLQVSCSGQASLSREFTLLLEPASYVSVAPIADDETAQHKQVEDQSVPRPGASWEIRPGDTLTGIARTAYPNSPARQHRLEQAIAAANPNIFSAGIKGDLPVGQTLNIPELPAIKRTAPRTMRSSVPAGHKASNTRQRPAATETFQLKLSTGEIDLSASRNITEDDRLKLREKQLLLEADDQVANIMALKNQVKQLESRLSELSLKMSNDMPNATPSPAPLIVDKATLPGKNHASPGMGNFWFGVGVLGILLGLFLSVRRYRRRNNALEQFSLEEHDTMENDRPAPAWTAPKAAPVAAHPVPEETYYDPVSIFTPPEENITLTEMDSVVEEADLYLIYGWTDKAVTLLQGYIEKHPQEVQPWIMLLDIYRSQGKKEAFDKLAHRFKENIADEEQWRKVQALGHEFNPKNSLYFSENQQSAEVKKTEDDFWAHSKTDIKPPPKK